MAHLTGKRWWYGGYGVGERASRPTRESPFWHLDYGTFNFECTLTQTNTQENNHSKTKQKLCCYFVVSFFELHVLFGTQTNALKRRKNYYLTCYAFVPKMQCNYD